MKEKSSEARLDALQKASQAVRIAQRKFEHVVSDVIPVGSRVTYSHGAHERQGRVVRLSDDRAFIVTAKGTGRWLYVYRIEAILVDGDK